MGSPNYIVGHDEHGPAYPDKPVYVCPVCGTTDCDAYQRCYDGGCPDGRDQSRLRPAHWAHYDEFYTPKPISHPVARTLIGVAIVIALVAWSFWPFKAHGMDHGFPPSADKDWFESLIQPDNAPASCCGEADAYEADTYRDNRDGTWTFVVTEGSAKVYPDGKVRHPLANGTEVEVPANKVNPARDQAGNPTGHAWVFASVYDWHVGHVYCAIPLPNGS